MKHNKIVIYTDGSSLGNPGPGGFGVVIWFQEGDRVDAVYTLSENEWNGNKNLQLKIRDLKKI